MTEFTCDHCWKIYATKYNLDRHVRAVHTEMNYACKNCARLYKYKNSMNRHEKTCNSQKGIDPHDEAGPSRYACSKCDKSFTFKQNRDRHERTFGSRLNNFYCLTCGKRCASAQGLRSHQKVHDSNLNGSSAVQKRIKYQCRRCSESFENRRDLYRHGMQRHFQTGAGLQVVPWGNDSAPWNGKETLKQEYETNAPLILEQNQTGPLISTYNFPIQNDVTVAELMRLVRDIYESQQHAFKLNLVFGVILRHRETEEHRFFRPYNNNSVSRSSDMRRLYLRLTNLDVVTELSSPQSSGYEMDSNPINQCTVHNISHALSHRKCSGVTRLRRKQYRNPLFDE